MKPSLPLRSTAVLAVMLCVLFLPCAVLADTVVTGTYSTGDGSDGNQTTPLNDTGPWTLTATNTTFSYLLFFPNENFTLRHVGFCWRQSLYHVFFHPWAGRQLAGPEAGNRTGYVWFAACPAAQCIQLECAVRPACTRTRQYCSSKRRTSGHSGHVTPSTLEIETVRLIPAHRGGFFIPTVTEPKSFVIPAPGRCGWPCYKR